MTRFRYLCGSTGLVRLFILLCFTVTAFIFAHMSNCTLKNMRLYFQRNDEEAPSRPILNPHPFRYLILEDDLCTTRLYPNVFLLIIIHSAVNNVQLRMSVRNTWGSKNLYQELGIVTVFLLGKPDPKARWRGNITAAILRESARYHDIIQEDFIDSYRNLTYKAISGLRWITKFCQQSAFVLKSDDDEFVNTYRLVYYLRVIYMTNPGINSIICMKWDNLTAVTDNSSKWYVSKKEFTGNRYPPYCSGSAVIMPTRIVPLLYKASFFRPFFWVDDVFVTGMLAQDINVTHHAIPFWYVFSERLFDKRLVYGDSVFGNHHPFLTTQQRLMYWNKITRREVYEVESWNKQD